MAILGEVFSIIRNGASIKQIDGANGFPITRIETISNRVIDRNRLGYANVFDITEYESYVLQSGDILMSHINSEKHLGKTALYIKKGNEKIIHGMNLLMLRANSEVILPLYAKYFFDSNLFLKQIPNITKKSVNQASFTVTALKKLEIKIPQMVEQKRIIDIMSRLDNIIQYRKDQLEKLDLFVKSRFIEMFGDPASNPHKFTKVPLSELADIKIGPFGSLLHKEDYIENGNPVVNPSHIVNGNIVVDSRLTISNEKYEELAAYKLEIGDVVLGRRGEMGRCAVVQKEGFLCGTGSVIIRTKGEVTSDYIQQIISFPTFKRTIEDMAVGQTMPNLNVPIVSNFLITKPPVEIQKRYYDFVAQVDKSKLAIQQSLDELETLKKSLMQQYFG